MRSDKIKNSFETSVRQQKMMEHGFNEILLVKFITKNYAFEPDLDLINQGYTFLGQIISALIDQNTNIGNLTGKNTKQIIDSVLGQYTYRFEGLNECVAAFGNFSGTLWPQLKNSQMASYDILAHEQIRKIIAPIKDKLLKISFFIEQTSQLPTLSEYQATSRKVQFLKTILNIQEPVLSEKKKKPRSRQKKDNTSSVGTRSIIGRDKSCCDLETSIKTEADQWTFTHSAKLSTEKTSTGNCMFDEKMQIEEDEPLVLQYNSNNSKGQITEERNWNELIIRYDDFIKLEAKDFQEQTKRNLKRQKQSYNRKYKVNQRD